MLVFEFEPEYFINNFANQYIVNRVIKYVKQKYNKDVVKIIYLDSAKFKEQNYGLNYPGFISSKYAKEITLNFVNRHFYATGLKNICFGLNDGKILTFEYLRDFYEREELLNYLSKDGGEFVLPLIKAITCELI